jgi:putative ABC transport system permease protein
VVLKRINVVKKKQISGLEAMVYFQFLLSVVLITISLWGYRQVNYLTNKDLGFEKEHLLHCSLPKQNSTVSYKSLRNEILAYPGIENMGISINSPMHSSWGCQVTPEGWSSENSVLSRWNAACSNYLSTMNLTLLEGRNLSDEMVNDKHNCLINETAARAFGWEKPIGKKLEREGVYTVVGGIKDFNIEDVHNPIIPYVLFLNEQDLSKANDLTFKIHPETMSGSLAHINKVLDKHFKDVLFEVNGYDANLQRLEIKIWNSANNTIIFFTVMAVIIAAMSLFGLIYYSAQRRTKEIGVRKVQGAKVRQILPLIIKKYLIMAIVVNVIVYPVADFLKYTLPGQYKYQFTVIDVVFILLISILITLISSGFQAYKASVLNPVKALRYE